MHRAAISRTEYISDIPSAQSCGSARAPSRSSASARSPAAASSWSFSSCPSTLARRYRSAAWCPTALPWSVQATRPVRALARSASMMRPARARLQQVPGTRPALMWQQTVPAKRPVQALSRQAEAAWRAPRLAAPWRLAARWRRARPHQSGRSEPNSGSRARTPIAPHSTLPQIEDPYAWNAPTSARRALEPSPDALALEPHGAHARTSLPQRGPRTRCIRRRPPARCFGRRPRPSRPWRAPPAAAAAPP
jgi:hypothetical protein